MTRRIMIQGTGSNVGKSMLVAGLCRALARRGLNTSPFKPQNMSNNAAVTKDGGEIGRAQALQARAAFKEPLTDFNPVLLKPEGERGSQVILNGKKIGRVAAKDYGGLKPRLLRNLQESWSRVTEKSDIVIVEGAGSPAEINLRANDIANMGFAESVDLPVILIGDIDRGGVIAQLVGTHHVLEKEDRHRIKGFAVNKFRGDPRLFETGMQYISDATQWGDMGLIPWFEKAHLLPAEDSFEVKSRLKEDALQIVVLRTPRLSNFDDFDPLMQEAHVSLKFLQGGEALPPETDLVIIGGSKSTISDLKFVKDQGWDIDLIAHHRRGGKILGICGGYQMLGRSINDPDGIEGQPEKIEALGILDIETHMTPQKQLHLVEGVTSGSATPFSGYEMHIGHTEGKDCARAWLKIDGRDHGAMSKGCNVKGGYVHGIFSSDAFRKEFLADLGAKSNEGSYEARVDTVLDDLAQHVESYFDVERMLWFAKTP